MIIIIAIVPPYYPVPLCTTGTSTLSQARESLVQMNYRTIETIRNVRQ